MQYTIRPLVDIFKDPSRDYVKPGDLAQIIQRIKNTQKQQLQRGDEISAATEEYIKILTKILSQLGPNEKLLKTALAQKVDEYIRANELHYSTALHPVKHHNTFYSTDSVYHSYQDLALYNSKSNFERWGHHKHDDQVSVCYARLERRVEKILIGNLQIDDRGSNRLCPWSSATASINTTPT